jgi:hypothetical protein
VIADLGRPPEAACHVRIGTRENRCLKDIGKVDPILTAAVLKAMLQDGHLKAWKYQ